VSARTPLRASAVRAKLGAGRFSDVRVFGVVTSTNDVAARLRDAGAGATLAVLADGQTAGRGRRGARWVSPTGSGLFVSVLVPAPTPDRIPLLAGAAGVAAASAVRSASGADCRVKWPNDLWIGEHKVGGVLVEARGAPAGLAIAGIGINLTAPPRGEVAPSAAPPAGILDGATRPVAREDLAAALLAALDEILAVAAREPAELLRRFRALDVLTGRTIVAETHDGPVAGRVASVDLLAGIDLVLSDGSRRRLRPEHAHVAAVGPPPP
jgi:BirA family biotin operon repressor/biotin-[acetyl-CoA-carboxylase] ligase